VKYVHIDQIVGHFGDLIMLVNETFVTTHGVHVKVVGHGNVNGHVYVTSYGVVVDGDTITNGVTCATSYGVIIVGDNVVDGVHATNSHVIVVGDDIADMVFM
jgi:hypothetical protein